MNSKLAEAYWKDALAKFDVRRKPCHDGYFTTPMERQMYIAGCQSILQHIEDCATLRSRRQVIERLTKLMYTT